MDSATTDDSIDDSTRSILSSDPDHVSFRKLDSIQYDYIFFLDALNCINSTNMYPIDRFIRTKKNISAFVCLVVLYYPYEILSDLKYLYIYIYFSILFK